MFAYKGFNKDLTCTLGRGRFQYELGTWHEEPEANCVSNGFHCAEDPLDVFTYYGNAQSDRYFIVEVEGDMDEDGWDSKISATRMRLVKELTPFQMAQHAAMYYLNHPYKKPHGSRYAGGAIMVYHAEQPISEPAEQGTIIVFLQTEETGKTVAAGALKIGGKYGPNMRYELVEGEVRPYVA